MSAPTLRPDPANPNRMDAADKARMSKSLAEYGDLSAIILNRRTGLLVGGHQRADVLAGATIETADLAVPEPDGTVARGAIVKDGKRYALRVVDWPEGKAHAAMLAANRFGRVGEDDNAALKDLLEALDTGAVDMDLTGYTTGVIETLMTQEHQEESKNETNQELPNQWVIMIECQSEMIQTDLLNRFITEGLQCKALIS